MNAIIFSELVSSNNFYLLLQRSLNLFVPDSGLGIYLQGIPTTVATDFFWGTNAGIRTLPLLSFLTVLQKVFGAKWDLAFLIIALIFPFLGFILSCRLLGKITLFQIIAAIFYGGNLWITTRIYSGFWQLNIAYAFLPLLVAIPIKISRQKNLKKSGLLFFSVIYAITASFTAISQPHFLIITSIFSFVHFMTILFIKRLDLLKRLLFFYINTAFIFILLNAYFLIPSILYPEIYFTAPNQYFSLGSVLFNSSGNLIEHILRFDPLGFSAQNFKWTIIEYLQLIPLLFYAVIFVLNKKRNYIFFTLVLLFIFLAKGFNHPGTMLSKWIYQNIFFMHYFRDPARFLSGVALFASFSISDFSLRKEISRSTQNLIIAMTVIFFIAINNNLLKPPKTDFLNVTNIPDSYLTMQKYINTKLPKDNGRLLILPNKHGIGGYSWYTDKNPNPSNTIYDDILPLNIPLADNMNFPDTPSNQISSYLYSSFTKTYDPKLLTPLGVKYILIDSSVAKPDSEREIAMKSKIKIQSDKNSYSMIYEKDNLSLFKLKNSPSFVSETEPVYAIGNLETIAKNYASESARPVILLNQYPNPEKINLLGKYYFMNKDLYSYFNNPELTLTSEILSRQYAVDILKAGWNFDKIFVNYEPYKMEYINNSGELFTSGRAVVSKNLKGQMMVPHKLKKGKYHILIKPLTQEATAITVTAGDVNKKLDIVTSEKLTWLDEGTLNINKNSDTVTLIKNDNNLLIIDSLLLVPENVYQNELSNASSIINSMKKIDGITPVNALVSKYSITPNKIVLNKLSKYLTYRSSYGKYWKSNVDSEKFMSDGYGMTFVDPKKSITRIDYFPNTVYRLSIILSAVIGLSSIIYLVIYVRKNRGLLFDETE